MFRVLRRVGEDIFIYKMIFIFIYLISLKCVSNRYNIGETNNDLNGFKK
tara:strand:- start:168 stop:314 length:147 start_codon:yes stop_codon:yes gene_type:complete